MSACRVSRTCVVDRARFKSAKNRNGGHFLVPRIGIRSLHRVTLGLSVLRHIL